MNDIGSVTPPRDFLGILLSKALTRLLGVDLRLTRDFSRVLIIPQRDERAVAQVTGIRPFEESNLTDQLRFHPSALLHLLHGERFSPSRRSRDGPGGVTASWVPATSMMRSTTPGRAMTSCGNASIDLNSVETRKRSASYIVATSSALAMRAGRSLGCGSGRPSINALNRAIRARSISIVSRYHAY